MTGHQPAHDAEGVNTQQPAVPWYKRAYGRWNDNTLHARQTTVLGKVLVIVATLGAIAVWLYITR
jgi:hypothetical protein